MPLAMPLAAWNAVQPRHPNELDLRRIRRALERRVRYRYVEPSVLPHQDGYRIESPCCSRTVDPEGGVIDIALIRWLAGPACWWLYSRDHVHGEWQPELPFDRLADLLELLVTDPDRIFWQ